ncbi:MAG: hypothetical protein AABX03_02750 [Nanoarchaeota archaeon]
MNFNKSLVLMLASYTISGVSIFGSYYYINKSGEISKRYDRFEINDSEKREIIYERNAYLLPAGILATLGISAGMVGFFSQRNYRDRVDR